MSGGRNCAWWNRQERLNVHAPDGDIDISKFYFTATIFRNLSIRNVYYWLWNAIRDTTSPDWAPQVCVICTSSSSKVLKVHTVQTSDVVRMRQRCFAENFRKSPLLVRRPLQFHWWITVSWYALWVDCFRGTMWGTSNMGFHFKKRSNIW